MTHYYCTRTTSGHLILHPTGTPGLAKWHQKFYPNVQIPVEPRWIPPKMDGITDFHQNGTKTDLRLPFRGGGLIRPNEGAH